ncbi:MAG TPA: FliA/WhiG family RNA polymerase sigma factor [Gaiellaceae bacterium]|jgi:RNA polymerase sigma factor for flagellar operon FliA|nr:FliA/WhiG family RNA polymerase sigma factor [Gaiellaceae bacterium]
MAPSILLAEAEQVTELPVPRPHAVEAPAESRRLTGPEAESLWRAWKERGDSSSRDRLVLAYSPMVKYLASRKARELPAHCELDDLVSCGLVAIIEAVDRFDPTKGATFEQYAWTRVAGSIVDELRRQDRVSRSSRSLGRSIERTQERWLVQQGRQANEQELASELKIGISELRDRTSELDRAHVVSLNAPAGDEQGGEIGETIGAAPGPGDPDRALLAREKTAVFKQAIETLSERERDVLTLVYVQGMQGAEIGRMLGVTESRVSQILASARTKLRTELTEYDQS